MLAKNLRTPRDIKLPALSLTTIASQLAPTGDLRSLLDERSLDQVITRLCLLYTSDAADE